MSYIFPSMILALRESSSARRDSGRIGNATQLVTYFWADHFCQIADEGQEINSELP